MTDFFSLLALDAFISLSVGFDELYGVPLVDLGACFLGVLAALFRGGFLGG